MAYRRKQRKRVRKIQIIEQDIANHQMRYERHLQWKERNKQYFEQRELNCTVIEDKISTIRSSSHSYKKILGVIYSRKMTKDAIEKVTMLEQELAVEDKRAISKVPELDFPYEQYPNNRCMYSDWTMIPEYLNRELILAKQKELKKEKQRDIRARIAKADNKTREIAAGVKLRLQKDHVCPYCGNDLGVMPHADHIYPVSRGGLSAKVNMVYVCSDCNTKKRDKTLRMFIEKFSLDRELIEKRLIVLGKEF